MHLMRVYVFNLCIVCEKCELFAGTSVEFIFVTRHVLNRDGTYRARIEELYYSGFLFVNKRVRESLKGIVQSANGQ